MKERERERDAGSDVSQLKVPFLTPFLSTEPNRQYYRKSLLTHLETSPQTRLFISLNSRFSLIKIRNKRGMYGNIQINIEVK